MLSSIELIILSFLLYVKLITAEEPLQYDALVVLAPPAEVPAPLHHDSLYDNPYVNKLLGKKDNYHNFRSDICADAKANGKEMPYECKVLDKLLQSYKENRVTSDSLEVFKSNPFENYNDEDLGYEPLRKLIIKLQQPERKFSEDYVDTDFIFRVNETLERSKALKNKVERENKALSLIKGLNKEDIEINSPKVVLAIQREPKTIVRIESKGDKFTNADQVHLQALVDYIAGYVNRLISTSLRIQQSRKDSAMTYGQGEWLEWSKEKQEKKAERSGKDQSKKVKKRMSKKVTVKELSSEEKSVKKDEEESERGEEIDEVDKVKPKEKVVKRAKSKRRKPKRFAVVEDSDSEEKSSEEKPKKKHHGNSEESDEPIEIKPVASEEKSSEASVPLSEEVVKKPVKSKPRVHGAPDTVMQSSGRIYKEGHDFRKALLEGLLDLRRRLPQFLPKRYHWDPEEFHKLGYFWFNGPQGKIAPGTWRVVY